ncbi:MAG: RNA 3'-phosphate cyclase [Desulfobacterales bacterium]|nr:RNA 3'-phosphate cyclase [Desulfobacterales bacterium]
MTGLEIDGSFGEGGGQILRTALALAAILQMPVEIRNIRAGRKKPGLRPQHLMGVKSLTSVTSAHVEGAEPGSMRLYFEPRQLKPGTYTVDIGTAGSTGLVLQAMMPGLLFAGGTSRLTITGGTHVPWSPCFHFLNEVFVPALENMGAFVSLEIGRWGWYPKGGGRVIASISPTAELRAIERASRGRLNGIYVLSAVSNLPKSIGERQRDQVLKRLAAKGYDPPDPSDPFRAELADAPSPGAGTVVFIKAEFENGAAGFTSLGKRGKPAEKVADEACSDFFQFMSTDAAVDNHLADQLVLYMALAKGRSSFTAGTITGHLLTNIRVIEQFLRVKFDVDKKKRSVSVEGVGFSGAVAQIAMHSA